ncbi:putative ankyrin repeat domain-containing protein 31 [Perca flavescens]|uniref:putative ankyrin repeat domain-containing protein 31 n=1 Tax=Perca flavescens TaxID=8167 RepID=UPI00106F0494|nr:putative ankyrin repeat domain-containing protein 31 [Perca flavescens]
MVPQTSQRLSSITADHSYATNLRGAVIAKPRDMEMTGSCNQRYESEMYGGVSSSDDDSISLLCDLKTWQSIGVAKDMDISDLYSQFGIKEQNMKVEVEINRLKPPEPGISSCTKSVAGPADSTTQLAKASQCLKFIKKQLNKRYAKGDNLLHKACKKNDLEQVKMLIQAGISVNMSSYAGWTALHEASLGDEAVVKELLKAGANVNARSFDGVTTLNDAVMSGNYQVVKLLLQHGANPSDRTVGGRSSLDMAEDETMKELLSFPGPSVIHELPREAPTHQEQPAAKASQCLKFTKKRLNKRDEKGENLLHKACKKNDLEQVKMLIQAGISVNMEDYAGWTALHEASLGDEAVVKELLKAGANVNARSFDGVTPLNDAVMSGNYQVVKLLLQHGANPSDRTVGGRSALDMAEGARL